MNLKQLTKHIGLLATSKQRVIVAIAGPPGAGKTTLAAILCQALNDQSIRSDIVPMDGFHLDNSVLSKAGLLDRKGSPPTFDAKGFVSKISHLAKAQDEVFVPIFDRDRDIAIAGAKAIPKESQILLVEGNYLLLNESPWHELQKYWDETVFISPPISTLEKRLIDRWESLGMDHECATKKALLNDIPNARLVLENSLNAVIKFEQMP